MTQEEAVAAPTLSTTQDEAIFEFQKYEDTKRDNSHLSLRPIEDDQELKKLMYEYYKIQQTVDFLKTKDYKKITLQFPDDLVCDSSTVAQFLSSSLNIKVSTNGTKDENSGCNDCNCTSEVTPNSCGKMSKSCDSQADSTERNIWILADTSYSPCCVDEVASQHVKGDLVIHYGDACLNPVSQVDVAYVFGSPAIDVQKVINGFKESYPDTDSKVVIMSNTPYSYILETVYNELHESYPNIAYADILKDSFPNSTILGYTPKQSNQSIHLLNRSFFGLKVEDDSTDLLEQEMMNYDVFHISLPASPRLLKLTTVFQSVTLYDPKTGTISQGPFPNLMRRYKFMHVARSSGTIGLLVNTLSLSNTKTILNQLKDKIKDAGKKHYMFVVGKPNVAKLANFESIDVWCILGCDHQGIILDEKNEYYKPIVTPFELLLSLNQELTWTGKWETDFNKILEQLGEEEEEEDVEENESYDQPTFNPVTGKLMSSTRPLRRQEYLSIETSTDEVNENALVERFSRDVVIKDTVSTAAIQLQNRSWTGLGSDYVNDETTEEGALVEEGIGGIARDYSYNGPN